MTLPVSDQEEEVGWARRVWQLLKSSWFIFKKPICPFGGWSANRPISTVTEKIEQVAVKLVSKPIAFPRSPLKAPLFPPYRFLLRVCGMNYIFDTFKPIKAGLHRASCISPLGEGIWAKCVIFFCCLKINVSFKVKETPKFFQVP